MSCEHEHLVHAYHDGQLGPAKRADFETHLAQCPACAELLGDLRSISQRLATSSFPEISASTNTRYHDAWRLANQRSVLRISSWLTGAAAAVLVGSLLLLPQRNTDENPSLTARPSNWELVAMMPPDEPTLDRPDELVEFAQWMAEDLSTSSQ